MLEYARSARGQRKACATVSICLLLASKMAFKFPFTRQASSAFSWTFIKESSPSATFGLYPSTSKFNILMITRISGASATMLGREPGKSSAMLCFAWPVPFFFCFVLFASHSVVVCPDKILNPIFFVVTLKRRRTFWLYSENPCESYCNDTTYLLFRAVCS